MPFEVRVDCPSCNVEGSRIETWDGERAPCRLGVPESARCRLCRTEAEGRVVGLEAARPGEGCPSCGAPLDDAMREARRCPFCGAHAVLDERAAARPMHQASALAAWAREEGLASADELVAAYFVLPTVDDVLAACARGERIETTFDVADYLFSGGGGAPSAGEPAVLVRDDDRPPVTQRLSQAPPSLRRVGGPREELLALASVAAADGEASVEDQAVLVRAAGKRGIAPLDEGAVRVWRPNEIDPPPTLVDRERVLEEMFQMAWADGQLDESELRVIRDFSRAWGIDPERLREWTELYSFGEQGRVERWLRRIGLFLFPAR
jgi:hypothetical protein